jgi:hypothetical protein
MAGLCSGTGNKAAPLDERKDDLYQTPPEAVHALLAVESLPHRIWEPACGPGAIVRILRAAGHDVLSTDLVDYASPDQDSGGVDFLFPVDQLHPRFDPVSREFKPDAIVTNPPFKNAGEFVERALTYSPYVAMLLRLAFLESEKRRNILDNGMLARVHVFRKRLPMMHRQGWEGRTANSSMAFAWFIWERGHRGPAILHRLSWEEFAPREAA